MSEMTGGGKIMAPMRLNLGKSVAIYENDYEKLRNKPTLNGIELSGDLTMEQFITELTGDDIDALIAEAEAEITAETTTGGA